MTVRSVIARVRVGDLDAAAAFYGALEGAEPRRFAFAGVELAAVGGFLLFSGDDATCAQLERVRATLAVADLEATAARLTQLGATVIAPATATPNGFRLIARHPDGAVFEYVSGPQGAVQ